MYNMLRQTVALFIFFVVFSVDGRIVKQCELARALKNAGVPRGEISKFVCIAKHESGYNTQAVNHNTGDYGIFQISHLYWCNAGNAPGKICGISCNSLLDDDISNDIRCARTIYDTTKRQSGNGFSAWTVYYRNCAGNTDGYIAGCL